MRNLGKFVPWLVGLCALALLAAHTMQWSMLNVDGTSLALLGMVAIAPFLDHIRKIKLGDFEAEIGAREVAAIKETAPDTLRAEEPSAKVSTFEDDLLQLVASDPRLGLAKVRIELEEILQAIFRRTVPGAGRRPTSMNQMLSAIQRHEPLPDDVARTLREVTGVANRAVHGEHIRVEDAVAIAKIGAALIEDLQWLHKTKTLEPISLTEISEEEFHRLSVATYKVTSVTPRVGNSEMQVRHLDQNGLDEMLLGYEEYTEFLVGIELIDEPSSAPARASARPSAD